MVLRWTGSHPASRTRGECFFVDKGIAKLYFSIRNTTKEEKKRGGSTEERVKGSEQEDNDDDEGERKEEERGREDEKI
jgi:hypothetical protein